MLWGGPCQVLLGGAPVLDTGHKLLLGQGEGWGRLGLPLGPTAVASGYLLDAW